MKISRSKFIDLFDVDGNIVENQKKFIEQYLEGINKYFKFKFWFIEDKEKNLIEYNIEPQYLNEYVNFDKKGMLHKIYFEKELILKNNKDHFIDACKNTKEEYIDLTELINILKITHQKIECMLKNQELKYIPTRLEFRKLIKKIKDEKTKSYEYESHQDVKKFLENISDETFPEELVYSINYRDDKIIAFNPKTNHELEFKVGLPHYLIYKKEDFHSYDYKDSKNNFHMPNLNKEILSIEKSIKNRSFKYFHKECQKLSKSIKIEPTLEKIFGKKVYLESRANPAGEDIIFDIRLNLSFKEIQNLIKKYS